ncbi:MAG: LD-carboxypeptidase [Lachnospiraceae bacterium]|nr:LD-carboxypeptidase [Lachnospiraceae bacterium]
MESSISNRGVVKTVEIVSLSRGVIGEPFAAHELKIGVERLKSMGLQVKFSSHALKGLDYIRDHPEERAADLMEAYSDPEVDMILCAIGGDDTYRLLPHLFENDRLKKVVNDKIFLGFSDTTINHFMLHKLGVKTFYGQSFLADICELDSDMLPYSRKYFEELITTGTIREIRPSDVWYEERTSFDECQIGVPRIRHENGGFELLQGTSCFSGKILGGCIDSIYDVFNNDRYEDSVETCRKYNLFPSLEDWRGRILLLESSEEKPKPELYEKMLAVLREYGVFEVVSGVLVGKPMDGDYEEEYKKLLVSVIDNPSLPILCNINIGHATPRCIIPFGVHAWVDAEDQSVTFGI